MVGTDLLLVSPERSIELIDRTDLRQSLIRFWKGEKDSGVGIQHLQLRRGKVYLGPFSERADVGRMTDYRTFNAWFFSSSEEVQVDWYSELSLPKGTKLEQALKLETVYWI